MSAPEPAVVLSSPALLTVPEARDALAARIGASLSIAETTAGELSEVICGDSTFTVEPVCTVRGMWRAVFDVVDPDGIL